MPRSECAAGQAGRGGESAVARVSRRVEDEEGARGRLGGRRNYQMALVPDGIIRWNPRSLCLLHHRLPTRSSRPAVQP